MTACLGDKTPVATSAHPECHPAFEPLRHRHIASLNVDTEVFRHRATGAVHYHIRADSTENVFLVALRTVPMDSSGVAHVLEHTVLCGSERFPVRDPFFMMLRRSLNTFMNAFTASDWTAYPFATKNRKDFDNLLQVYLDAVFFARLDPLDFAQEGHRLELADPTDPASPLVFKGVVYNEMKGAMSSPVSTLWQQVSEQLYPTTTYHYNSGGDPAQIPDLSYEQLTAFYRTHYHPSNAVFMTYGDMSATAHQTRFEELALSRFEALDTRITVGDEQRYTAPRHVLTEYAADEPDDDEAKTHLALAWLLGRSTDLDTLLQAHLLSSVLLDSSAAPLRYALESTTLGRAPSPLCGLEDANREMSFVCGLEGSRPEHAEAFEALVLGVLRDVAEHGIEAERLEAALHQLELQQREVEGDGYPYGLHLMMNALPAAIHGGDPLALLNLDPALEKLREDCRDPNFIRDLVHRWLLDNPHRVAVTMQPDATLAARQAQAEASHLAARRQAMSDAEILRVKSQATALAERQQQKDDAELLPKVDLLDVPRSEDLPRAETLLPALGPTTFFCQPTNGLVYQQLVMPLPSLDAESVALLPLYTECLTELGVGTHDYRETQAWQETVSGGVHAYASFRGNVKDEQQLSAHLVLSGKALARNHARLIELMHTTLHEVRFDEHTRIRELVAEARARREERITDSGHTLALRAASSGMSPEAVLAHRLHGLAGIEYIRGLDDRLGDRAQLQVVADQLLRIHQRVLTAPRQHLIIGDAARRPELRTAMAPLFGATLPPSAAFAPFAFAPQRERAGQLWIVNTQVNFCAKAYPTVAPAHPDAAPLTVLGEFMRNGYLHRAVREQGGAYGAGAAQDSDIAAFRFYSYRDPRLTETLEDFDRAVDWLLQSKHERRAVEEAVLGVIGALDKTRSPAGAAKHVFFETLHGRNDEHRRRFREQVLATTLDDLQRVAATYLHGNEASVAVVSNAAELKRRGDLGLQMHRL